MATIVMGVVTPEILTGFVVLQFKVVLQLLFPELMVQLVAVILPYGAPATETVTLLEVVPATLLQ